MIDLQDLLKREIREANRRVVRAAEDLTDGQVAWRPGGTTPSISFHLWHSARWADTDQAVISGEGQVWRTGGHAGQWRLPNATLGEADTGTGLSDDQSAGLILPGKITLLAYVRAVFVRQADVLDELTPDRLMSRVTAADGQEYFVQGLLLAHLNHVNRHLGMIEALKGLQGLRGTATR